MRTFVFKLVLALTAWSAPLALRAADVQLVSASLNVSQPCPGQLVSLLLRVRNINAFAAIPGRVHATIELAASHPSCGAIGAVTEADKWWVLTAASTLSSPVTPSGAYSSTGGYNLNLGVNETRDIAFPIVMPSGANPGAGYKVHVGVDDYYVTDSSPSALCSAVTACLPPSQGQVQARVEGAPNNGEPQLLWFDYSLGNISGQELKAALPACMNILSTGLTPGGGLAVVSGQNITWALPNADASANPPYQAKGSLWALVQLSGCSGNLSWAGEVHNSGGSGGAGNSISEAVGLAGISLSKSQLDASGQPVAVLNNGDTVKYVLNYGINADGLRCFESFDGLVAGTTYASPSAPANWVHSAAPQPWKVLAQPEGGNALQYQGGAGQYADLLYDCAAAKSNGEDICGGIVLMADVRIDGNGANGDVALAIRSDGKAPEQGYYALLSVDPNPSGHIMLERLNGASITWPSGVNLGTAGPVQGQWYSIKALEQPVGSFRIKVWRRGDPESSAWAINYTDPSPLACGSNGDGTVWRPGLAGMADLMSFDNVRVLSTASVTGLQIWDTIPVGIDYQSAAPAANGSVPSGGGAGEGVLRWDFTGSNYGAVGGVLYAAAGSFTWTGVVDCLESSGPILNTASARASILPGVSSNSTSLSLNCAAATATQTVTATVTITGTPTVTPSPTGPAGTGTFSPTISPTPTTVIGSATISPTRTATPSITPSGTACGACSPTFTPSLSASPTVTPTSTPCGACPTASFTAFAGTASMTRTLSSSPTQTLLSTPAGSLTATTTSTPTRTPSVTPSITACGACTPAFTPTISPTPTSCGICLSNTFTPYAGTPSMTRTTTASSTITSSPLATMTPGPPVTFTKQVLSGSGLAGSQAVYLLDLEVGGTTAAFYNTITDTLPAGTTFNSAQPAPDSVVGNVVTWTNNMVLSGSHFSITLTVDVTVGGSLCNQATHDSAYVSPPGLRYSNTACVGAVTGTPTPTSTPTFCGVCPTSTSTLFAVGTVTFTSVPGSATRTRTPSSSPTATPSATPSRTACGACTPTFTATISPTPTSCGVCLTNTFTPYAGTPSMTGTRTVTKTITPTVTPTGGVPGIDLVVLGASITIYPVPACYSGQPMGLLVQVRNQGSVAAGAFVVDGDGFTQSVSGLAAGTTVGVFLNGYGGGSTHSAVADLTGLVAESNEGNNTFSGILPIPTPPPSCGSMTPTPTQTGFGTPPATPTLTVTRTPCGTCTSTATPTRTVTFVTAPPTQTATTTATPTFTATRTWTTPGFVITFVGTSTPTPWNQVTPLACGGTGGNLGDPSMDGPVLPPAGAGAYLGSWNGGVVDLGAGRSGAALRLDSAGGYMGSTSEATQDVCLGSGCATVCVWARGASTMGMLNLVLEQLDANAAPLNQKSLAVVATTGWSQLCLNVGDSAFPRLPAAVALRVRLINPPIWSTATTAWFDDITLVPGVCASTPTRTPPPPPGGGVGTYPYPNPARGTVNIAIQSPGSGTATILILNGRGLLVTRVTVPVVNGLVVSPVNISRLARGLYYYQVRLVMDDGTRQSLPPRTFVVLR